MVQPVSDVERLAEALREFHPRFPDYDTQLAAHLLPVVDAIARERTDAAMQRVVALADSWDDTGDARYSANRIARQTAARAVRDALRGER